MTKPSRSTSKKAPCHSKMSVKSKSTLKRLRKSRSRKTQKYVSGSICIMDGIQSEALSLSKSVKYTPKHQFHEGKLKKLIKKYNLKNSIIKDKKSKIREIIDSACSNLINDILKNDFKYARIITEDEVLMYFNLFKDRYNIDLDGFRYCLLLSSFTIIDNYNSDDFKDIKFTPQFLEYLKKFDELPQFLKNDLEEDSEKLNISKIKKVVLQKFDNDEIKIEKKLNKFIKIPKETSRKIGWVKKLLLLGLAGLAIFTGIYNIKGKNLPEFDMGGEIYYENLTNIRLINKMLNNDLKINIIDNVTIRDDILKYAKHNELNKIMYMIDHGYDVNKKNTMGDTPILRFVESIDKGFNETQAQKAILLLISNKANIDSQDRNGRTSLHLSILKKHPVITEFLLKLGADISIRDDYGYTALDYIIDNMSAIDMIYMANKNFIDINTQNIFGKTYFEMVCLKAIYSSQSDYFTRKDYFMLLRTLILNGSRLTVEQFYKLLSDVSHNTFTDTPQNIQMKIDFLTKNKNKIIDDSLYGYNEY